MALPCPYAENCTLINLCSLGHRAWNKGAVVSLQSRTSSGQFAMVHARVPAGRLLLKAQIGLNL